MKQINFSPGNDFIQLLVDVTETILSQYSIYITPLKKTREPEVSWRFQGVWKWNIGLKWVKYNTENYRSVIGKQFDLLNRDFYVPVFSNRYLIVNPF